MKNQKCPPRSSSKEEWATYYFVKAMYHYYTKGNHPYTHTAIRNALDAVSLKVPITKSKYFDCWHTL